MLAARVLKVHSEAVADWHAVVRNDTEQPMGCLAKPQHGVSAGLPRLTLGCRALPRRVLPSTALTTTPLPDRRRGRHERSPFLRVHHFVTSRMLCKSDHTPLDPAGLGLSVGLIHWGCARILGPVAHSCLFIAEQ